jgi:hypothetical protein
MEAPELEISKISQKHFSGGLARKGAGASRRFRAHNLPASSTASEESFAEPLLRHLRVVDPPARCRLDSSMASKRLPRLSRAAMCKRRRKSSLFSPVAELDVEVVFALLIHPLTWND